MFIWLLSGKTSVEDRDVRMNTVVMLRQIYWENNTHFPKWNNRLGMRSLTSSGSRPSMFQVSTVSCSGFLLWSEAHSWPSYICLYDSLECVWVDLDSVGCVWMCSSERVWVAWSWDMFSVWVDWSQEVWVDVCWGFKHWFSFLDGWWEVLCCAMIWSEDACFALCLFLTRFFFLAAFPWVWPASGVLLLSLSPPVGISVDARLYRNTRN